MKKFFLALAVTVILPPFALGCASSFASGQSFTPRSETSTLAAGMRARPDTATGSDTRAVYVGSM
jgi:hypothetical protein